MVKKGEMVPAIMEFRFHKKVTNIGLMFYEHRFLKKRNRIPFCFLLNNNAERHLLISS